MADASRLVAERDDLRRLTTLSLSTESLHHELKALGFVKLGERMRLVSAIGAENALQSSTAAQQGAASSDVTATEESGDNMSKFLRDLRARKAAAGIGPGVTPIAPVRFHFAPSVDGVARWHSAALRLECEAENTLRWSGGLPLPAAPRRGCWLLPTTDDAAFAIASQQADLRLGGWRLLTCELEAVRQLSNKVQLVERARVLGLLEHLPRRYDSVDDAEYPDRKSVV